VRLAAPSSRSALLTPLHRHGSWHGGAPACDDGWLAGTWLLRCSQRPVHAWSCGGAQRRAGCQRRRVRRARSALLPAGARCACARTSPAMRRSVHCSMVYRHRMLPMSSPTSMRSLTRSHASRPPSVVLHTHAISSGTRCWPAARRGRAQVAGRCAAPGTAPALALEGLGRHRHRPSFWAWQQQGWRA